MRFLLLLAMTAVTAASARAQTNVTHYEQDDPRITYTGTWYPNSNSLNSGGSSTLANLKGSQAVVTFNGTGINWLGTSDPFSGYCYVYLDGVPSQVDTGNGTNTLYRQSLFSAHNLTPGMHTLTIEITHSHDEVTDQSWIWVDAFEVDNGTLVSPGAIATAGLVEQTSPAVWYGGHWFQNMSAQNSGGSVNSAVDSGAWVQLSFNGTGVDWIGYRDEWSGMAQVYVDGTLQSTVDTYSTPSQTQTKVYSVAGLAAGTHTLKIVVMGTQDASSAGPWVWVDAFRVTSGVAAAPSVNAGGVVNAASYAAAPNNQVAAGQIISIFGSNFLDSGHFDAASTPLPRQLGPGNLTAYACGTTLPLFSIYPGQINAQLPNECTFVGVTSLTLVSGGQTSTPQDITLARTAPAVFTVNASGSGDGVVLHGDNSPVNAANPAKAGEQVVIYATGLGPTEPPFATGAPATSTNQTVIPVGVEVGNNSASVVYTGLTVGLVGLYQINVIIPAGVPGSQPLSVTSGTGGNTVISPSSVTIAVAP